MKDLMMFFAVTTVYRGIGGAPVTVGDIFQGAGPGEHKGQMTIGHHPHRDAGCFCAGHIFRKPGIHLIFIHSISSTKNSKLNSICFYFIPIDISLMFRYINTF